MHQSCLHFFLRKAKLGRAYSLEGVLLRLAEVRGNNNGASLWLLSNNNFWK